MTVPPQDIVTHLVERGIVSTDAIWTPAIGGRTNRLWHVRQGQQALTVKLYSAGYNPLFPNDPNAEARVLLHLDGQSIAPQHVCSTTTPIGQALLYQTYEGACWTTGTSDVGRLLKRLHGLAIPPNLRRIGQGPAALIKTAHLMAGARVDEMPPPPRMLDLPDITPVFLHGDVVSGNLIQGSDGLRLIDWQCPAIGDPSEDLAIFLSPAMQHLYRGRLLSDAEQRNVLHAYGAPEITARARALAPFFHYRMAAYCLWKMAQGDSEYAEGYRLECAALEALRS